MNSDALSLADRLHSAAIHLLRRVLSHSRTRGSHHSRNEDPAGGVRENHAPYATRDLARAVAASLHAGLHGPLVVDPLDEVGGGDSLRVEQ